MSFFEYLGENPLLIILISLTIAIAVVIFFVKFLIIDNWDKIFKKKNNSSDKAEDNNQTSESDKEN